MAAVVIDHSRCKGHATDLGELLQLHSLAQRQESDKDQVLLSRGGSQSTVGNVAWVVSTNKLRSLEWGSSGAPLPLPPQPDQREGGDEGEDGGVPLENATLAQLLLAATSVLDLSHNRITSFRGLQRFSSHLKSIDFSSNSLSSLTEEACKILLDPHSSLLHLESLDLSGNKISKVDFTSHHPKPGAANFSKLRVLNLSDNSLAQLPLGLGRAFPQLKKLDLSDNDELSTIHQDFNVCFATTTTGTGSGGGAPSLALEELVMAGCGISDWMELLSLAGLASTLATLDLRGSPVMENHTQQTFHLRGLVAWVLPLLEELDGSAFTPEEEALSSILFRSRSTGALDQKLLLSNDRGALEHHLKQRCTLAMAQQVLSHQQQQQQVAGGGVGAAGGSDLLRSSSASTLLMSLDGGGAAGGGGAALDEVQDRLKRLNTVVKVLKTQYYGDRIQAGRKILPWYRLYRDLRKLFPDPTRRMKFQRSMFRIRHPGTFENKAPSMSASRYAIPNAAGHGQQQQPPNQEQHPLQSIQQLEQEIEKLSKVMSTMWNDFTHLKSYVSVGRNSAAMVIQKYYRGYKSRRESAKIKAEFSRFRDKFLGEVLLMQRVGRRFLATSRNYGSTAATDGATPPIQVLRKERRMQSKVRRLEGTVESLGGRVEYLEHMLQTVLRQQQQPLPQQAAKKTTATTSESPVPSSRRRRQLLEEFDEASPNPVVNEAPSAGRGRSTSGQHEWSPKEFEPVRNDAAPPIPSAEGDTYEDEYDRELELEVRAQQLQHQQQQQQQGSYPGMPRRGAPPPPPPPGGARGLSPMETRLPTNVGRVSGGSQEEHGGVISPRRQQYHSEEDQGYGDNE